MKAFFLTLITPLLVTVTVFTFVLTYFQSLTAAWGL